MKVFVANRVVLTTITMIVVVGVLVAAAALLHTRRVSDSYDEAIKRELEEKALAYGDTAAAFLNAAGPEAFTALEAIVLSSRANAADETASADPASNPEGGFSNAFLSLEVWMPDASAPGGFRLFSEQEIRDGGAAARDEEAVMSIIAQSAETGRAAAALDEKAELILTAVPVALDEETTVVVVGSLAAEDEFAFFAAQRGQAIREGILLSLAIIAFVALIGGVLSALVSRQLSKSNRQLQEKSDLLEIALGAERERARHDPLTGALNHAVIVDQLRGLMADRHNEGTSAVAMIDVDGLKAVNDTFGHQMGDEILVTVAKALTINDALVGRYGGDEFLVILPDADRAAAERYRDDVLDVLAAADIRDAETGASVPVVASVGIATYPDEANTVADLIKLSDSAMYAARQKRPVRSGDDGPGAPLTGGRAAEMVGEIVPLLTSGGDLSDKLRLVGRRLSVGAGYDAVNFTLLTPTRGSPLMRSTFGKGPDHLVDAWDRQQRSPEEGPHPLRLLLERTRRPIILEDPQNDERLSEAQRSVLRAGRLESALVVPMLWQNRLVGVLSVASARRAAFGAHDAQFLTAVATQVTAIVRMETLVNELSSSSARLAEAQEETVMLLAASAEAHDSTTGRHLQGVRALAEALAQELGYDGDATELGLAAVLHDIGKIRVHDALLSSIGALTDEDWELMKRHTVWGSEFLAGLTDLKLASTIARSHHERWDGTGYPDGLSGEEIPVAATIVAVADSFDAITSDRPYRRARSIDAAVQELATCSGTQFNPAVIEALLRLHDKGLVRQLREATANQPKAA